jgi:hypothetical protein
MVPQEDLAVVQGVITLRHILAVLVLQIKDMLVELFHHQLLDMVLEVAVVQL